MKLAGVKLHILKAIKIEGISKQYRLGQTGTGFIAHDINRFIHAIRGKEDPYLKIGEVNDRTQKSDTGICMVAPGYSF